MSHQLLGILEWRVPLGSHPCIWHLKILIISSRAIVPIKLDVRDSNFSCQKGNFLCPIAHYYTCQLLKKFKWGTFDSGDTFSTEPTTSWGYPESVPRMSQVHSKTIQIFWKLRARTAFFAKSNYENCIRCDPERTVLRSVLKK